MKEKRRERLRFVNCKYTSAGGEVPWLSRKHQLGSLSDIHAEIGDGSLVRWLQEFDARAREKLGEDCELAELTVRMEDCFYLADYEPGEELKFANLYAWIAVCDRGEGGQAIIGAAAQADLARKMCQVSALTEVDDWAEDDKGNWEAPRAGSGGRYTVTRHRLLGG